MRLRVAHRNEHADNQAVKVDAGNQAGQLRIYAGTKPAGPDDGVGSATLLLTFTLNDPAFLVSADGTAVLDVTPAIATVNAASSGVPTFGRFGSMNSGTFTAAWDVDMDTPLPDISIDTATMVAGQPSTLLSYSFTMPGGS